MKLGVNRKCIGTKGSLRAVSAAFMCKSEEETPPSLIAEEGLLVDGDVRHCQ